MLAPINYGNTQPIYNNGYEFNNTNGGYPNGYPPQITTFGYNMHQQYQQPVMQQPMMYNTIPNTMNSMYSPPMPTPQQQLEMQQNGGYFDNETYQFITNDKPLKAGPDNPLEPYSKGIYSPYVPGQKTGYIELEKGDGTIDRLDMSSGAILKKGGGYNPATGEISVETIKSPSFESRNNIGINTNTINPGQPNNVIGYRDPKAEYNANNGTYSYPNGQTLFYPQPTMIPQQPLQQFPIHQGFGNNYIANMNNTSLYGVHGYAMNEFDDYLRDVLYSDEPYKNSPIDVSEMLEGIVLTDEEREKINHNNRAVVIGRDYYGRPIFNNYYAANQQMQEAAEAARNNYINHFANISKIVHAYNNEKFDEHEAKERFDPLREYNKAREAFAANQPKPFNIYSATEEEKKTYYENIRIMETNNLAIQVENFDRQMYQFDIFRNMMKWKIKESHDAALGVKPGESYDLSTYLTNAHNIVSSNKVQEMRQMKRNGKLKYNSKSYKNAIDRKVGKINFINTETVTPENKDMEVLTLEEAFKSAYEQNRAGIPFTPPDHPESLMINFSELRQTPPSNRSIGPDGIMIEAGKNKQLNVSAYNDNDLEKRLKEMRELIQKRFNQNPNHIQMEYKQA